MGDCSALGSPSEIGRGGRGRKKGGYTKKRRGREAGESGRQREKTPGKVVQLGIVMEEIKSKVQTTQSSGKGRRQYKK